MDPQKETPSFEERSIGPLANADEHELNLLDLLVVLTRSWKLITGSMAAAFVLACVVTLVLPNIYTATARLLPPREETGSIGAMLSGMGDLAALAGVSVGGAPADLYVGMLKSRTVADVIIDRFDLMTVYSKDYRIEMYEKLEDVVSISAGDTDGIISISVDDEDSQRAAAIANAYVEELKKLNVRLNLSNAGRERVFLEERLSLVKGELVEAEDSLREFQEKNKAIKIDAQATAIIEAISKLKGELASKEVELGVYLTYLTEQSPQVQTLREGIKQLKEQLRRLEDSPSGKNVSQDIFIATSDVPDLGMQYVRLMRDFKIQETICELLTRQYEMAKITEAKNTSTIQVLDEATAPDKKSKPRRTIIVVITTFAAGLGAVVLAFVLLYRAQMPEKDQQRWLRIRQSLPFARSHS